MDSQRNDDDCNSFSPKVRISCGFLRTEGATFSFDLVPSARFATTGTIRRRLRENQSDDRRLRSFPLLYECAPFGFLLLFLLFRLGTPQRWHFPPPKVLLAQHEDCVSGEGVEENPRLNCHGGQFVVSMGYYIPCRAHKHC
ncbi:hypothetical protein M3Y99_00186100 [Aphelenchoides fujianensis]|nr:hypothetical protein M3Y99_00186100 [Aphelenchoides fujianensis]